LKEDNNKPESNKKLVSRRDFLVAGGAVIAAGAVSACTPKTETVTNTVTNTATATKTVTNTTTQTAPAQTSTVTGAPVTTTKTATTTATATVTGAPVTTTKTTTVEATYAVVTPRGEPTAQMITMAPRLDTLAGKTIGLIAGDAFKADITFPKLYDLLKAKYPTATIIPYKDFPYNDPAAYNSAGAARDAVSAAIKAKGCHAVITGNGG